MRQCSVPKCKTTIHLHAVPFTDATRWKAWLINCPYFRKYSLKQLENVKICESHFLSRYIINHRLSKDAIPTLNLQITQPCPIADVHSKIDKYLEISPLQFGEKLSVNIVDHIPSALQSQKQSNDQTSVVLTPVNPVPSTPCHEKQKSLHLVHHLEPTINVTQYSQPLSPEPCVSMSEEVSDPQTTSSFLFEDVSALHTVHAIPSVSVPSEVVPLLQNTSSISPSTLQTTSSSLSNPVSTLQTTNSILSDPKLSEVNSALQTTPVCKRLHSRHSDAHKKSDIIPRVRLDADSNTPRKQTLRQGNVILKRKLRNITLRYNKLKAKMQSFPDRAKLFIKKYPLLNNFGKLLIDSQLRLSGVKPKGSRYTNDEKVFALSFYKLSPRCYRFFQKRLRLPAPSTISSLLTNVPLRPGINDFIFQHLTDASKNKNVMGLQCVLLFDEMAINKNLFFNFHTGVIEGFEDLGGGERTNNVADKVLVFMLRGIFSPWKLPLAYYFVRDGIKTLFLKNIIKELVKEISKTGFVLRSTVSDQGSANVAAINSLIADTREELLRSGEDGSNILHYVIDGKKIYHVYDVPHLLKCFRNNFQKKDLLIGSQRAQWDFIERLYAADGMRGLAYQTTKLTDKHVKTKSYDKMKVKYAAQVFSREVADGVSVQMKTYHQLQVDHNYCPPSVNIDNGVFTADILLFIHNLFSSLNCSGYSKGDFYNSLSLNSNHLDFWNEAVKKLESMKFDALDSRESKPLCLRNFIHVIKTVKHLWSDLRLIPGVKFLSLRRLNQDPLENFFSQIRGQGGSSTHPDCHNFVSLFKTLLINNITTGKSLYANCTEDEDKMLGTLKNLVNRPKLDTRFIDYSSDIHNTNFIEECVPSENIFQTNALSYIAGAVCRYLFPKLNCDQCQYCRNALLSNEIQSFHTLIQMKEYDANNRRLYYPSSNLLSLVWHCINIIEQTLPNICKVYIYADLINKFELINTSWLNCLEHKSDFLKAFWLFVIRMQVRQWCINFNRRIHNTDSRKKGKEMENLIATKVTIGASYRTVRRKST